MAEKDMTEKTLEAYGDVFADIVNDLLFKGEQVITEDALVDAQPFSMYKSDGALHQQERDSSKYWVDNQGDRINVRIALFGLENQTNYDKDMPLRVIGYDGASYRAQLEQQDRYPVVTLVLYFGDKPWGKIKSLHEAIPVGDRFRPFVNDYKINLFEICDLPEEAIDYFHSDFRIVVDYFVRKKDNPDYRPSDPQKFKHVDEILKLMSVLTQDERFVEVMEGGKPENMCDVLDRVEARGEARGKAEGIAKGIIDTLASLVKKGLISLTDAAEEAGMTPDDFKKKAGLT